MREYLYWILLVWIVFVLVVVVCLVPVLGILIWDSIILASDGTDSTYFSVFSLQRFNMIIINVDNLNRNNRGGEKVV